MFVKSEGVYACRMGCEISLGCDTPANVVGIGESPRARQIRRQSSCVKGQIEVETAKSVAALAISVYCA
jgi:hypothetical protein